MTESLRKNGVHSHRLPAGDYARNFADLHPPLDAHEALVAADRCYFCHDAPCVRACPTEIDIPLFIRQIAVGDVVGSAKTILDQNILGGMCARVCPTETLCEGACVREAAEGKPVQIGLLQRHATDHVMRDGRRLYERASDTGKTVAVIGAGPAGLACAHALAVRGHSVVVYEAREKPGGLNEYGIAAYKVLDDFSRREAEYILSVGGIAVQYGVALGRDISLGDLRQRHDAVFLGVGLRDVNALDIPGADAAGVEDAVDYIAKLRQTKDLSRLPVGRRVVVIGGGMTAIDIAVQSKMLGAEEVTIAYRGKRDRMKASPYEREVAAKKGAQIRCQLIPREARVNSAGAVEAVIFEYAEEKGGELVGAGETVAIAADQVFKAIGQRLSSDDLPGLRIVNGKIAVDAECRADSENVWAGGDCAQGGDDLTVSAVAMGRDAAAAIHKALGGGATQ